MTGFFYVNGGSTTFLSITSSDLCIWVITGHTNRWTTFEFIGKGHKSFVERHTVREMGININGAFSTLPYQLRLLCIKLLLQLGPKCPDFSISVPKQEKVNFEWFLYNDNTITITQNSRLQGVFCSSWKVKISQISTTKVYVL